MDKITFINKYASHLNKVQLQAVQSVNGPVLLLAVPGSGKTTVLVNRLGYMLHVEGIAPENILTLTYTVAATRDMAKRFEAAFGENPGGPLEFRTINGICSKIIITYGKMIGRPPYSLVSEEKKINKIISDILVENLPEYPGENDVKNIRTLVTYCKNMLLSDEEIEKAGEKEKLPLLKIYKEYNDFLKKNRLMDYDDQLVYAFKLLKKSPELLEYFRGKYRYICVDEAQDTSKIQHMIIGLLAGRGGNLFMVGDEDQSIYGFRAAYPEALLRFESDHPGAKVLVMDTNYRSDSSIVAAADGFIQHNTARYKKNMKASRGGEADIKYVPVEKRYNQYNYLAEVARTCDRETAVLYRDNESAIPMINILDRKGIPFRIRNADPGFFTHRVVSDIVNILSFALNSGDSELFMKIYYKCQTFLRKGQAAWICRISQERGISVPDAFEYCLDKTDSTYTRCRAFAANLRLMRDESPSEAIFRIEHSLGYREYLQNNGIDGGKIFILKQIAYGETSVSGFLDRLIYLRDLIKNKETDYKCKFILSTIHSAKGLEYDRVYLMDVCDGVFPGKTISGGKSVSQKDRMDFEEERRIFYVGITRAKNNLSIFKIKGEKSRFIEEMRHSPEEMESMKIYSAAGGSIDFAGRGSGGRTKAGSSSEPRFRGAGPGTGPSKKSSKASADINIKLSGGERVVSKNSEAGEVVDIFKDENGSTVKFRVRFDSGKESLFMFPLAFETGMKLED